LNECAESARREADRVTHGAGQVGLVGEAAGGRGAARTRTRTRSRAGLTGSVTTRAGRRLAGRLVYDLDESETTDTLDAPSQGVDYTIPMGLIASVVLPGGAKRAQVTLQSGEELELERAGDLGEKNAGILIFADGGQRPEYVPWADVGQVDLDRPPAMYPPDGGR